MNKVWWYPQLPLIVCRQFHSHQLTEVELLAAEIHRHNKHGTLRYTHQFASRMLELVMQATQHPFSGFAVIVLNEIHVMACGLLEITLVEAFKKETTVINENIELQNQNFWQSDWCYCVGH